MVVHVKRFPGMHAWLTAILVLAAFGGQAASSAAGQEKQGPSAQASSPTKPQSSEAQRSSQAKQKLFSSPQDAADALYAAAQNHDEDGMLIILGPDARDVVIWTESPEDRKADTDLFVEKYAQMHRLVKEPDDETTLYVGAENWPLPIPLVEKNGVWYFDSGLGRREILYRRIGENELETVDNLRAMVDAENEYYSQVGDSDGAHEYARRLSSTRGQRDGLYWSASKESDEPPVGPYLAQASFDRSDRKPLLGYYFRILTEQGPKAPGGARKYIVGGKMTGGFAFVAFPAEYRVSGVMTFIIDQDGIVYEKDLGPMTAQLAKTMTAYNPDSTWIKIH